jgi:hypothetical protein
VGWPSVNIPSTDEYFELKGVSVMEIRKNLIRRNSDYWDWNSFMKGLGLE